MKYLEIRIERGTVLSFDPTTSRGKISLSGGNQLEFHSTCFQSVPPTRFPHSVRR